ncbi:MAG: hypothetical protein A2104_08050 [Candidatus Melainabacteria bacterium GWF2_32_7]|nr:MAG: hypothetical protein A2104_08050 [Candidatus Melainabacteria bacterium GWF2_32_7]
MNRNWQIEDEKRIEQRSFKKLEESSNGKSYIEKEQLKELEKSLMETKKIIREAQRNNTLIDKINLFFLNNQKEKLEKEIKTLRKRIR